MLKDLKQQKAAQFISKCTRAVHSTIKPYFIHLLWIEGSHHTIAGAKERKAEIWTMEESNKLAKNNMRNTKLPTINKQENRCN